MKRRNTGPAPETVQIVLERDRWSCTRCGRSIAGGERGRDWSVQHRIPRGMGGSRDERLNLPSNLLVLCGSGVTRCHGDVETHREIAHVEGFLLHRIQDPTEVPLNTAWGWVRFDNEGGARAVEVTL
jgi:5-methylcytosine-specific restriction protein A